MIAFTATSLHPSAASADEVDVVAARADCDAAGLCGFVVTLRHADTGWDHYADRWEVVNESGEILATRVLQHPHVGEQPFTRFLAPFFIPREIERVRIRAHDSVHGASAAERTVELSRDE